MRLLSISQRQKQSAITVMVWIAGLWMAWNAGQWIAEGEMKWLVFLGLGSVLSAIALMILRNWRAGFYLFLVWLLFEDLIRKYLGNNMAIFFAKDVLAGISYISLLLAIRRKEALAFRPRFLLFLTFFFWLAVLDVFNPYSPSPLYGLLGLKVDFFYIPLMFLSYALIREERDLKRFLVLFMVLAIVISGIGIVQAIVGPGFLSPAKLQSDIRDLGALEKIAPLTGQAFLLPSSVFVSTGRFALYLILGLIVGLASVAYFVLSSQEGRKIAYVGIGALSIAVVLSGSRTAFLFSLISAAVLCAAFLWGAPWGWGRRRRLVKAVRRSLVFGSLALAAFIAIFPTSAESRLAFFSQTLLPSSSAYELSARSWSYPMGQLGKALSRPHWIIGNGTGTDTLGNQYVSRIVKKDVGGGVEEGLGQMIEEMGILAPVLWILWSVALITAAWKTARLLKGTRFFPIAVAIVWYTAVLLFALTYLTLDAYQNYINNAFCWLLVGVLFRLPDLAACDAGVIAIPAEERNG